MHKTRTIILSLIILGSTAILVVRLFSLQVASHEAYRALAENQHQLYRTLVPRRGEIFIAENRQGKLTPAVTNIEKSLVFAVPSEIADKDQAATALAKLLAMSKKDVQGKISDDSRKWVALKKELPGSEALAVEQAKISGIYLQPESFRFYPEKVFASQTLGFFAFQDNTRVGQYGIEEYYQEALTGRPGSLSAITGNAREVEAAVDGADVVLTIDRAIQYQAETILKNTAETHQADDGSIVVMDPKTGRILALANYPSFDPNAFGKVDDPGAYRNRAVTDAYEPGSVFKPVTMAAGIDTGAVTPDMTFEDTGSVQLDEFTIRNANNRTFGVQNMTAVLEQSINTGAMFVEEKTGRDKFREYVKRFGFGEKTGITLPTEAAGDIRNLERGGAVHYATASFGQGITATALQLAAAYGALANEGRMMRPYIVEKIIYPSGESSVNSPQTDGQVISPKSAHTVGAMLVSVVENGHGKRAAVPGYYIGGKTGTAQMAKENGRGYDEERTIGTFAGFGPIADPRFVIVVKITNPKTVKFAESTAAPAFGELAKFLVNYFQIPPSR